MNIQLDKPKIHTDRRGFVRRIADGLSFLVADTYSTSVFGGERKGQHWYDTKIMAYVCLVGTVEVSLYDPETQIRESVYLSDKNYCRLTIQPGIWATLVGIEPGENILVVCASEDYDPSAVHTEPLEND